MSYNSLSQYRMNRPYWDDPTRNETSHDRFFSLQLNYVLTSDSTEVNDPLECCKHSLLHHSVRRGLQKETLLLLNKGADVSAKNKDGQTPVHVAVKNNNIELVKIFSERTTDINIIDLQGKTPLHCAVLNGHTEVVGVLLQHGGDPNIPDNEGNSPFHCAFKNCLDSVEMLVEHVLNVDLQNSKGETPLHFAVFNCNVSDLQRIGAVRMLLDKGAGVNVPDHSGKTPLHILVREKFCPELGTLLFNKGGNILLQDVRGRTPLHNAIGCQSKYATLILEHFDKSVVNIPDNLGDYPLHTAVKYRLLQMVNLLLDNGASIESKNGNEETALQLAILGLMRLRHNNDASVVNLLLERGAQVNVKDKCMKTPLHIAARLRFSSCNVEYPSRSPTSSLLARGALPNSKDSNEMTPLHYAVQYYRIEAVNALLKNGADVNSQDIKGRTPLMFVGGNMDILEFLLVRGADVTIQDKYGRTVLHRVASNFKRKVVEKKMGYTELSRKTLFVNEKVGVLLDWGAPLAVKDHSGKTPFGYYEFTDAKIWNDRKKACLIECKAKPKPFPFETCICKDVAKMKELHIGNNTLFDVFRQYHNPKFLLNKDLQFAAQSQYLKDYIPVYASLLQSTYMKARKRVELFDAVADILQTPLPIEVLRYILTFVDNDSLSNVVKAKEELFDVSYTFLVEHYETIIT